HAGVAEGVPAKRRDHEPDQPAPPQHPEPRRIGRRHQARDRSLRGGRNRHHARRSAANGSGEDIVRPPWTDGRRGGARSYFGITSSSAPASPGFSPRASAASPSSCSGYSAGSSRRLSTNSGTSSESDASASGPSPTRTIS